MGQSPFKPARQSGEERGGIPALGAMRRAGKGTPSALSASNSAVRTGVARQRRAQAAWPTAETGDPGRGADVWAPTIVPCGTGH
jgi:hypothetical protein